MRWDEFIRHLNEEMDWAPGDAGRESRDHLVAVLREVQADPTLLTERVNALLADDEEYRRIESYIEYPRTLMDKFTIYVHPEDLFRVRLHRFWPRNIAGNAIEKVHYHKWDMASAILRGGYVERTFLVLDCDEEVRTARLEEVARRSLGPGDINVLEARVPHQVHNPSLTEPCVTLFVRGPSLQPYARIFSEADGTFYDTFSPTPQRRHALRCLAELDGYFHPIPEVPSPALTA